MQRIEIKTRAFFEMIKSRGLSMWEVMAQMIDGEEKEIVFLDEEKESEILMRYKLPASTEQLKADQKEFAQLLATQLAQHN